MSTFATTWAWAQNDLDPPQLLTLLALAEGANHQGQCWPTKATMQAMTSMSADAVAHCLKELESKGVLRREIRDGDTPKVFLALDSARSVTQGQLPAKRDARHFEPSTGDAEAIAEAVRIWNEMAERTKNGNPNHRLAKCVKLNDSNKKKLRARLSEFGLDGWAFCVEAVEHNAHCRGVNDRGWHADIGYLLQPQGSSNTINGRWAADYEEKTNGGQRTGPSGRGDQRLDGLRSFDAAIRRRAPAGE